FLSRPRKIYSQSSRQDKARSQEAVENLQAPVPSALAKARDGQRIVLRDKIQILGFKSQNPVPNAPANGKQCNALAARLRIDGFQDRSDSCWQLWLHDRSIRGRMRGNALPGGAWHWAP